MNQEKSKNKKKIAVITLFSALVLGGVSATAYLMTKPSSPSDRPQHLKTTDSSNGTEVEFVESPNDNNESTSKEKDKSKNKIASSSSSSGDKKELSSSSSQSNHSNRREGATPIDLSRVANTREEGANSIAPITQVRDIINRVSGTNRPASTGSNTITAPDKTSKEQEEEARRLAEIEARRKPKTDNTNTIPTSPTIPAIPSLPIAPVIPIVPSVTPVIPVPTPAPINPGPVEEEKPSETKPAETPPSPAEEKPVEKPVETKPDVKKPVEEKPVEKPVETKPDVKKPAEEKPVEKPVETKPDDKKPAEGKPAEKPSDKKPSETKPVEEKPTDTAKEEQNVTATIRTQEDLNSYLKKTGRDLTGDTVNFLLSEDVRFPKETYKFLGKTTFNFPANPEGHTLDFNGSSFLVGTKSILRFDATGKHGKDDSNYLTVKNFVVYGSIEEERNKNGSINIKSLNKEIFEGDGRFSARLAKASNMKFENATFNNAHGAGSHLFDIAGSDHIVFEKITAAGFGGKDLSEDEVERQFKKDPHSLYSEAIQIDSFLPGAYGHISNLRNSILSNLEVDNKPSSDITINNSTFTSYVGFTGQDIADGNTAKPIVRNFGATIGSHTEGSDKYKNITITNNKFENTIGFGNLDGDKNDQARLTYPIHFKGLPEDLSTIKIEGNTFNDKVFARTSVGKFVHGIYSITKELLSPTNPDEKKPAETKPVADKPAESKPAETVTPVKEPEAPIGSKPEDKNNTTGKTDKDKTEAGNTDKQ